MDDVNLVKMVIGEEHQASNVLSFAMVSNPIHVAVLRGQGEADRKHLLGMFLEMFNERPGIVIVAKQEGTIVGVLRSYDCHGEPASQEKETVENEVHEAALTDTDSRMGYWLRIEDEHDPLETHRHLGPVGVLPQFQGHGIGKMMMERFCADVDANSEPAYLETDKPESVKFYEKFRFRLISETEIFNVRYYFMWRPAQ